MDLEKRDLYSDLLRAFSLGVVVLGHWLELITSHLKPIVAWTSWLTWVFQVIPIFFMVGGSLNAASWTRAQERGETWAVWVRRRAQRLLMPLAPLVALWLLLIPFLLYLGVPRDFVHAAALTAVVPAWFLGAYLAVVVLTPVTHALHRRFGFGAVALFVAPIAIADAFVHRGDTYVGDVNVVLVWGAIHQIGYFWHDRYLRSSRFAGSAVALAALVALLALVDFGGYPISMVVVDAGAPNNAAPPSLALFMLGLAQIGLCVALRKPLTRWMQKPSAQKSVGAVGQFTMTVFLWHMTAILLVAVVAWGTGNWPEAPDINGSRWAVKPLWLALIGVVLALLVLLFRRVEAWPTAETLHKSRRRALTGVALSLAGITWIGLHGLDPSDVPVRISLAMVGVLFVGMWMLDATPPRMRRRPAATGEPVEAAE
ncbi:MAG: hypothetical protein QOE90_2829 [Thermoplasmata archaeon]|jgi:hypothetical protein|nr:hypothetical protein [Thermoplasmata archaeon]